MVVLSTALTVKNAPGAVPFSKLPLAMELGAANAADATLPKRIAPIAKLTNNFLIYIFFSPPFFIPIKNPA